MTRNVQILGVSLVACLLLAVCAEIAFQLYVKRVARSRTAVAGANDAARHLPAAPPADLLAALKTPNSFNLRHSVSEIAPEVRTAFARAAGEQNFSMADPGNAWEATDVIMDRRLPRRRLTALAVARGFCLVFYEHGGFAANYNVAAFRTSAGSSELIWHAVLGPAVADAAGLRDAISRNEASGGGYL